MDEDENEVGLRAIETSQAPASVKHIRERQGIRRLIRLFPNAGNLGYHQTWQNFPVADLGPVAAQAREVAVALSAVRR